MKKTIIILLLLGLFGCELPCARISKVTDMGALPGEVLSIMPYEDGDELNFLYSGDTLVQLAVSRETRKQYDVFRDECNNLTTIYEVDITSMAPTDSSLTIVARVANLTAINRYQVTVNSSTFIIPVGPNAYMDCDLIDSLQVNGTVYYDVCRLYRIGMVEGISDNPLADSVYFNTEFGVLDIVMEDGSRYSRQE